LVLIQKWRVDWYNQVQRDRNFIPYPMSTLDEIKARIDIVDLVSETVQLRRTGKNYLGFCPFHSNTRTPAFVVFPETGTWRCFGQCNEGGDIFSYVMKKEGWDFQETLRFLADKAGVQLRPFSPQEQVITEEHDLLRSLLEEAVTFYRHQLFNTPPGEKTLQYLQTRGLNKEIIEAFEIGYAPDSWDSASLHFKSREYKENDLLEVGLVSVRESGGVYDRFRHRVMFPIRDERGRITGFGGRILNPDDVPKFINSPQTQLFDKGHLLYGLDRARKAIRANDQVVIVEGFLDVIALHQAGFENSVSPMGTALTEHQLILLKRFTRRMVLALDPDAAGVHATMRGLEIARHTLDHTSEPVFNARGLLGHEARLQADLRVTTLPEGMDPDDVVNRNPADWKQILDNAQPIVIHVMETLARSHNLDDPKEKSTVASSVLPLIQDIPNPIERDTYIQRLARLLRVDERTLLAQAPSPRRRYSRAQKPAESEGLSNTIKKTSPLASSAHSQEAFVLGVFMRRPALLYQIDRSLQECGLSRLSPADFQLSNHKTIFQLLQESINQDASEPLNYMLSKLSLDMMENADDLLARTERLNPNDERVLEEIKRTLLTLRKNIVDQAIDYHRHLIQDAQDMGDNKASQYHQIMVQLGQTRLKLDQALG
jgi:DNA primase